MAPIKRKYRTIYLVTAVLMVAMVGGYALALTTTTTGPTQGSNVTTSPTTTFLQGTVTSEQLVVMTSAMVNALTAGSNPLTVGLGGTPTALSTCAGGTCAAQNFRPFSTTTPTVGNYGEQIVLSVTQPTVATGSSAFDFSISVSITIGGTPSTLVFQGFLATGTTSAGASATVPVFLFGDLGTQNAPVIVGLSMVFNTCASATSCP
jgi:hypothetical protein